jgi:hypothetical protein
MQYQYLDVPFKGQTVRYVKFNCDSLDHGHNALEAMQKQETALTVLWLMPNGNLVHSARDKQHREFIDDFQENMTSELPDQMASWRNARFRENNK